MKGDKRYQVANRVWETKETKKDQGYYVKSGDTRDTRESPQSG